MKKILILIILLFSVNAKAQDEVNKIVLKYGKHQDFYRFVLICEKPAITYSINVNLLSNGKIKLTFTSPFEIEFEGRIISQDDKIRDLKIYKNENSLIIGTSNITKIKVSRLESPSRLVIDAFFEELAQQEEKIKSASILIDPGHGGQDMGIHVKENSEKNLVLYISKEIASRLAQKGIKVALTRASDEELSLKKRLKIQNTLNPSLFLSLHLSSGDFFFIYTSKIKKNTPKDDPSKIFLKEDNLVKIFIKKIKENFSEPVYSEKLPGTLLIETSSPALLIEIPKRSLFSDKKYLDKIIDTFVNGIMEHFKVKTEKTNYE